MRSPGARRSGPVAGLAALACVLALGSCGGDDSGAPRAVSGGGPGAGGALAWALSERPEDLDPLRANTRSEQLVTRQVHEPLVESLVGPFGDVRRLPGLALATTGSADNTIWRLRLRPGVRFQDGTPFNAAAVLANGERWRMTPEGRALMPGLFALDAPRPYLVRFFLDRPDPDFPERLASPQAGIVSPRALPSGGASDGALRRETRSGTGPFELRENDAAGVLVARNLAWWGTDRELGPALDQVEFRIVPDREDRLALLQGGDVQLAEGLRGELAHQARQDPLLEILDDGHASLGLERSVRGVSSATEVPSLSGVWLTSVGAG